MAERYSVYYVKRISCNILCDSIVILREWIDNNVVVRRMLQAAT